MSYAISLSGPAFQRDAWIRELGEQVLGSADSPSAGISPLYYKWYDPRETLRDTSGFWILPRGGIRGVTIGHRGDMTVVSLPAGNSSADFDLVWDIVRRALRHGALAGSEDEPQLDGSEGQCEAIARRVTDDHWNAILAGFPRDEFISLSIGGHIHLTIPRIASTLGPAVLQRHFSERMDAYADARHIVAEPVTKESGVRMIANYSRQPTLMDARTEEVHLDGACLRPGNKDLLVIDVHHFHACFDGEVEHLGAYHHVPAASDLVMERLLVAAREKSSREKRAWLKREIPAPIIPPRLARTRPLEMTTEEWMSHLKAPGMIHLLVNGLGAVRDTGEVLAFSRLMDQLPKAAEPLVNRISDITRKNAAEIFAILEESGEEPAPGLAAYGDLLYSGKLSEVHAGQIGRQLVLLAWSIASHRKKKAPVNQAADTRIAGILAALEMELIR